MTDMVRVATNKLFAKRLIGAVLVLPLLALAPGCTSTNLPVVSASSLNSELQSGYRIGTGDKLKVTVFDEESLTGEYAIGDGGLLAMPLIDPIDAEGKTASQLAELVAAKYKQGGYVLTPRVSVEIVEHRPFFILGEVAKPGEYDYTGDLTLSQAVAKAGGYTPRANRGVVELKRQAWPAAKLVKLDGQSLMIEPGDTITVREAFF